MNMRHLLLLALLLPLSFSVPVMGEDNFKGELFNEEYNIIIKMNFYDQDVIIPGQEIFGEIAGYFKAKDDSRCWIFTAAEVNDSDDKANLEITNDYGSEDLTATLFYNKVENTYTLKQEIGSTLKIARKGKWVKIPKNIVLKKRNN